jgi:MFS transporter, DHA2 family, multidrug resistance protein
MAMRCAVALLAANNQFLQPSTIGRSACAAPSSHYLVTRGATDPDAINQDYGLAANLMTQQVAMMAFMDCFHLLGLVVLAGLPLAFFIQRFWISNASGAVHYNRDRPAHEIGRSSGAAR